ncbi:hypothetical protein SLEP1_g35316 [Rubroshorea leprosula]|uniref:Uncharacterized protein n=1 Tax=Rubroshorea leprosula TaxID=152421 RepID=A0AAV5KMX7_9ROSI|nr:hypothetical protein SLEP1_g35316 [Rubroshorea leprosula]
MPYLWIIVFPFVQLFPRQEPVLNSSKCTAADTDQKLRVCDICGAFLSVYDSGPCLPDHFGGKLHLGYMQICDKLAKLLEERSKSRKLDRYDDKRSKERSRDHERESSWDSDRGNSRDQARDYDPRSRDHDRYSDRDRNKDYERSRTYDSLILEVTAGHVQGLGNTLGIMIATGVTDTRCMNAAQEENEYETVLAYVSQLI